MQRQSVGEASLDSTQAASEPAQRSAEASPYRAMVERTGSSEDSWRVGIEARISQLKRSFGLRRTRLRRLAGAQTWVGLGIFAYNLQRMTVVAG
jgi:transposase, IS5 family